MHYRLDPDVIQRITDANDIVDLIEEFLPLKKVGANYSTNCPFHKEKTPSFVVSKDKQLYHCFGCGESGDTLKFLMEYKNFTFAEAAEFLAKRGGIVLEEIKNPRTFNNKIIIDKLLQINREAATYFYNNIKKKDDVLSYLFSRKIDIPVIKRFGIGYANAEWDNLLKYLLEKGFTEDEILNTGLICKNESKKKYYDRFRNRIIFPIFDIKKNIIGFGGRVLDNSLPKYLNSPESIIFSKGNNLYGLDIAKEAVKNKYFFLVEGYMDVIKMHINGYNTAVAALGTALTENQIKLMKRYSKDFYIALDSDEAGQKAALKAMNMLKRNNLNGKVIILSDAKDPDEFLNKYGKAKFEKSVENALDYYDFLEFHYKNNYESSDKVEYINKFFDNIINVNSEIEKELILEKLSAKMGVSKESIIRDYNKKINKEKTFIEKAHKPKLELQVEKITTSHEIELIKLILYNNDLALYLKEIVNEETFKDLEYYSIFEKIYDYKKHNQIINRDSLEKILNDKMDVGIFVQEDNVDYNNLEALFMDCKKRLKIKYYEKRRTILSNSIKQSDDITENNKKMNEIFSLAKKIKSTKEEVC